MKRNSSGWLREYLEIRKNLIPNSLYDFNLHSSPLSEYSLYKVVQPTGLMYGQPVGSIIFRNSANWTEKSNLKVILAENLINCSILLEYPIAKSSEENTVVISKSLKSIIRFYNYLYPEIFTSGRTFLGIKRTPIEVAELILTKRVKRNYDLFGNFWVEIFQNCLLFLDIYVFGQWIQKNQEEIALDYYKYEKDELRISLIKIIAAAAHSNSVLEEEERHLIDVFINKSTLSKEQKQQSLDIFEKGIAIEDIDLPVNSSWILKKFFLEVAILTTWSDRKFEPTEYDFINRLASFLSIPQEEVEASLLAVEGFTLENWNHLDNLQDKVNYNNVGLDYIERLSKITEHRKTKIIGDLKQNKEVMELLNLKKTSQLSEGQEPILEEKLFNILKKIPLLAILELPKRFLTLPNLLMVLPKEIYNGK